MTYPAKAIANAVLNKAAQDGSKISHLKLQKLLYYVCGYYLAITGEPLIDYAFEAWDYGPVVPEIYHEFKDYGGRPITSQASTYDVETGQVFPVPIPTDDAVLNRVIDFVWKNYKDYSAATLSEMTHREGSPWDIVRRASKGIRGGDIPLTVMEEHFKALVHRRAD